MLDKNVEPRFENDSGKALANFTDDYIKLTQQRFGTENMSSDEIKEFVRTHNSKDKEKLQMTDREWALSLICENDIMKLSEAKSKKRSVEEFELYTQLIFDGINNFDLKSFKNYKDDPDCDFAIKL